MLLLAATTSGEPKTLVWRGAPLPKAKSFLVTECGFSYRLAQNEAPHPGGNLNFHFEWEFGWMRNLTPRWALGGAGYFSADDDGSRAATKLRLRRWFEPDVGLDLGAGPIVAITESLADKAPGFVGSIALSKADLVAGVLTIEIIPYEDVQVDGGNLSPPKIVKGTETTLYAGIRLGSYPGGAVGVIAPLSILFYSLLTLED